MTKLKINGKNGGNTRKRVLPPTAAIALAVILIVSLLSTALPVSAKLAEFEYNLSVTDGNGKKVTNPRLLPAGSTLNIEIEMKRTDTDAVSYATYGVEFRIISQGLEFNGDGATFISGTDVRELEYSTGKSVGFAYYDMEQKGVRVNNPMLAGKWSYKVTDPSVVNITVPVALLYNVEDSEAYVPVGNAILYLDLNGGRLLEPDVSGEYRSGTSVKLPAIENQGYTFLGWSDGAKLWAAGESYQVSGIVTLTAMWEGIVRSRQIGFALDGGEISGVDPSGMYADGETVIMPEATKRNKSLDGWRDNDTGAILKPGDEYVVDNSKIFTAVWVDKAPETEPIAEPELPKGVNPGLIIGIAAGVAGLGLLIFFFLLFWMRRNVLYSLVNGDIALGAIDKKNDYTVKVILIDKNNSDREITLDTSRMVEKGHRLRFIVGHYEIVKVEKGRYKGKLVIRSLAGSRTVKCRIRVLDRKIRERKNK